jgi:hypothetical protein
MPQYAIFLYAPIDDGHDEPDDDDGGRAEHERFSDELQSEGNMIGAFVLESYETATSVRADGITDGPFIEAKEVVLGLYVLEAENLDEALANAKRNPILRQGGGIEVRPIESFVVRPTTG